MTLTAQQERLNQSYLQHFGRTADHSTQGGGSYWLDTHNPQTDADWAEIDRMLGASAEAQSYATDNVVRPGGVRRDSSTYSQGVAGQEYAAHFQPGGALEGLNSADTLNTIAANTMYSPSSSATDGNAGITAFTEVPGGYFQFADQDVNGGDNTGGDNTGGDNTGGDNTGGDNTGTSNWYDGYGSGEEWLAANPQDSSSSSSSTGGVDDFMKFMMFMSMMRPQGGMGGGSQYGYGGLNPGGVQSAYNPMDNITNMMSAFNSLPGIGTNLTNTGTAAAA